MSDTAQREPDPFELLGTIDQRDQAEAAADMLARDIARITGAEIGGHSNLNSPWENAHEAAEEHLATPNKRGSDDPAAYTYVVQHNPNCPSPYLVRLPRGVIDMKGYAQTSDAFGHGKTFEEAFAAAIRSLKDNPHE